MFVSRIKVWASHPFAAASSCARQHSAAPLPTCRKRKLSKGDAGYSCTPYGPSRVGGDGEAARGLLSLYIRTSWISQSRVGRPTHGPTAWMSNAFNERGHSTQ